MFPVILSLVTLDITPHDPLSILLFIAAFGIYVLLKNEPHEEVSRLLYAGCRFVRDFVGL